MQVLSSSDTAALPSTLPIQGAHYDPARTNTTPTTVPLIRLPSFAVFDPSLHLCYQPPSKTYTFHDLGLEAKGISPVAATEAFPLFTSAAIRELRKDALSTTVHDHFSHQSTLAAYQAREYAAVAPFVQQAFTSPEFLRAVSEVAGIELVPIMSMELGHTNFQVAHGGREAVRHLPLEPAPALPPTTVDESEPKAIVDWHYDSYPFVAVTMLSDVKNMIGGETAIAKGDGSIAKIRGPDLGYTAVLQGRYVRHIACGTKNARERITMVTSFRAKDCSLPDDSVLTTIRPVTNKRRMNREWSAYRLKLVAERMNKLANEIEEVSRDDPLAEKEPVTKQSMQKFVQEQFNYLNFGINEMIE